MFRLVVGNLVILKLYIVSFKFLDQTFFDVKSLILFTLFLRNRQIFPAYHLYLEPQLVLQILKILVQS